MKPAIYVLQEAGDVPVKKTAGRDCLLYSQEALKTEVKDPQMQSRGLTLATLWHWCPSTISFVPGKTLEAL